MARPAVTESARRVDVHIYFALGILGFKKQELRGNKVSKVVGHGAAQEHDPILEQSRVDVVGTFAAAGLLDYIWYEYTHATKVLFG